jgi:hypothetical protein
MICYLYALIGSLCLVTSAFIGAKHRFSELGAYFLSGMVFLFALFIPLLHRRLNVLVQVEEVGWIIPILEGNPSTNAIPVASTSDI